jgi:hypothetical protein
MVWGIYYLQSLLLIAPALLTQAAVGSRAARLVGISPPAATSRSRS